jgi:hypothetical protein
MTDLATWENLSFLAGCFVLFAYGLWKLCHVIERDFREFHPNRPLD